MKQNYNFRGGETPYKAPSVEVFEIPVERGFANSPVSYDPDENLEQTNPDGDYTQW